MAVAGDRMPIDDVPAGMLVVDDGVVVGVNAAAVAELGVGRDVLVGEKLAMLAEDAAPVIDLLEGAGGGTCTVWLRPDLGRRLVEMRSARIEGGEHLVAVRDVTEAARDRAVVAWSSDVTYVIDANAEVTWRAAAAPDRDLKTPVRPGAHPLERIHPDDLPVALDAFARALAEPGLRLAFGVRGRHPLEPDRWEPLEVSGVSAIHDDVLRGVLVRLRADDPVAFDPDAQEPAHRVPSLVESAPVGILLADANGRTVYRNDLARALLGPESEARPGAEWVRLARPEHAAAIEAAFERALKAGERVSVTAAFDRADGRTTWLRVNAAPQRSSTGTSIGLVMTIDDVTDGVEARLLADALKERLSHLASHDVLTGLPNRVLLYDRVEQALARQRRAQHGVAVMFCDLDGFKAVNDTEGHVAGDKVLRAAAERFRESVRDGDTVARIGGDEFVVLCEGIDDEAALCEVAARIIVGIREPDGIEGRAPVGVSIGIALTRAADAGIETLLAAADDAMYDAKAAGKGCCRVVVVDD